MDLSVHFFNKAINNHFRTSIASNFQDYIQNNSLSKEIDAKICTGSGDDESLEYNQMLRSGLSQEVTAYGDVLFVDIYRSREDGDWSMRILGGKRNFRIWRNCFKDDVNAFIEAQMHIWSDQF